MPPESDSGSGGFFICVMLKQSRLCVHLFFKDAAYQRHMCNRPYSSLFQGILFKYCMKKNMSYLCTDNFLKERYKLFSFFSS